LLRLGVIRESRAGFYSHAFVVPKPGKKWRLVLDFKPLNKVSEVESGWGIPNIQDIMRRLGSHRPKYFAVMDLTAGFHQTPIDRRVVNLRPLRPLGAVSMSGVGCRWA